MKRSEFLVESPEDFQKEMNFDKFMDEIVLTETRRKVVEEEETDIMKIIKKSTQRPSNSIRYGKKR